MSHKTSIVDIKNGTRLYKLGQTEVKALDKISLSIAKGDFVAITGASGSGKSTLLHIIGFLDSLTSGSYIFDGLETSRFNDGNLAKIRNMKIGFVFQSFNLLPRTPAIENVKLPALYSKDKRKINERAKALLEKVNLGDRLYHKPSQLSGGEQQRAAIARALINNPEIILADEPTGNLDSKSGEEILSILSKLNEEGKTVLIVTHDLGVADKAKRRVVLKDGNVIHDSAKSKPH
ncbi:ABC transporter ATP-binding protein [candidate division WWE3 bacterium]|nr:ABC transporter ATP-binding protein [candidate division WWE3 bacterium]